MNIKFPDNFLDKPEKMALCDDCKLVFKEDSLNFIENDRGDEKFLCDKCLAIQDYKADLYYKYEYQDYLMELDR